jgi:hypothetical protein
VLTYALPFAGALAEQGIDPAAATSDHRRRRGGAARGPGTGAQAGALLSDDLDASGTARAGLVIVQLDLGAGPRTRRRRARLPRRARRRRLRGSPSPPFSENIFADELLTDMEEEMPVLLGVAFLLIIGILFITYRRVGDVVLGLAGLVITIVWTYGIAVLLGPSYLGITGVMSQISMMIPVLLIGLAIDYAIHLTSRYREDLATRAGPPDPRRPRGGRQRRRRAGARDHHDDGRVPHQRRVAAAADARLRPVRRRRRAVRVRRHAAARPVDPSAARPPPRPRGPLKLPPDGRGPRARAVMVAAAVLAERRPG